MYRKMDAIVNCHLHCPAEARNALLRILLLGGFCHDLHLRRVIPNAIQLLIIKTLLPGIELAASPF